jgi:hypothetical protein
MTTFLLFPEFSSDSFFKDGTWNNQVLLEELDTWNVSNSYVV